MERFQWYILGGLFCAMGIAKDLEIYEVRGEQTSYELVVAGVIFIGIGQILRALEVKE